MVTNEEAGYKSWFTCPDTTFDLNTVTHTGVTNMLVYPKRLCLTLMWGMFTLVGGSVAQFAVPGVIGLVVDAMNKR